jgi:hypothetical protein
LVRDPETRQSRSIPIVEQIASQDFAAIAEQHFDLTLFAKHSHGHVEPSLVGLMGLVRIENK